MARVVLENVRVDFPIYATQRNLRTAIFNRATGGLIQHQGKNHNRVVVTALSGLSMMLQDGDRVGLIGHNGSGKSTLLKVIAGIYEPIEGRVMVEGAVTPLFDMMPGLDPEDSGYENIFTAGLLLGLSREEIEARIPEVEEFSELGEYMALPVRTYSTGMTMRLGFALLTALDPGVLLMDEGIGAGDARFAERAERRLNEFVGRSRILVVASHSPALIKSICNKAALMAAGRILAIGPVQDIFDQYHTIIHGAARPKVVAAKPAPVDVDGAQDGSDRAVKEEKISSIGTKDEVIQEYLKHVPGQSRVLQTQDETVWHLASFTLDPRARHESGGYGNEWAECLGGSVETLDGVVCESPEIQLPFRICLRFRLLKDSPYVMVPNFHFHDELGNTLMVAYPARAAPTARGEYHVCCVIEPFVLNAGRYTVGLALSTYEPITMVHFSAPYALRFEVVEWPGVDARRYGWANALPGVTRLRLDWQYAPVSEAPTGASPVGLARDAPTTDSERVPVTLDRVDLS
jgi:ABC-type polysaccharide/polyol phosphate transport system ATPase subunit